MVKTKSDISYFFFFNFFPGRQAGKFAKFMFIIVIFISKIINFTPVVVIFVSKIMDLCL